MGDVLEDGVQLDESEEAELWVECGQVLSATWGRGPASGGPVQLCWSWPCHHSQLPALPGCQKSPPSVLTCPRDCSGVFNLLLKQLFRRS